MWHIPVSYTHLDVYKRQEYAICNKSKLTERLPQGFNYAGTIAFAGAIFSTSGDLKWQTAPSPIQMFHGDADRNVPFDKTEMLQVGLYGRCV